MTTELDELKAWLREQTLDNVYPPLRYRWVNAVESMQADLKKHDAWLGQAHVLCSDLGVAQGSIGDRLFEAIGRAGVLQAKLNDTLENAEMMRLFGDRLDHDIEVGVNNGSTVERQEEIARAALRSLAVGGGKKEDGGK